MNPEPTESKPPTGYYHLILWVEANRKQILWGSGFVAAVIIGISLFVWNKNQAETKASEALSTAEMGSALPNSATPINPSQLEDIAKNNPDTSAGARALLRAGSLLYESGKYADARGQFQSFLQAYAGNPMVLEASLGVAACFEAEGNMTEAATRYTDILSRHPGDPMLHQARVSLARMYALQDKPEQAFGLYEELLKASLLGRDTWVNEAEMESEELMRKYPKLRTPAIMNGPGTAPRALPPGTSAMPPKK